MSSHVDCFPLKKAESTALDESGPWRPNEPPTPISFPESCCHGGLAVAPQRATRIHSNPRKLAPRLRN